MGVDVACLRPSSFTGPDGAHYTDVLDEITDEYTADVSFDDYRVHEGEFPDAGESYGAVVVTGSEAHVYDEDAQDWVEQTERYLEEALDDGTPVLGICYGHQVLADTLADTGLGGSVERMPEREMGYNEIELTAAGKDHPLFDDVPDTFVSFTSHMDYVPELPEGTVGLAENEYGDHSYAAEDVPAYGVQFHPEYDLGMALKLLEKKEVDTAMEDQIFATYTEENVEAAETAAQVLENFFEQLC